MRKRENLQKRKQKNGMAKLGAKRGKLEKMKSNERNGKHFKDGQERKQNFSEKVSKRMSKSIENLSKLNSQDCHMGLLIIGDYVTDNCPIGQQVFLNSAKPELFHFILNNIFCRKLF